MSNLQIKNVTTTQVSQYKNLCEKAATLFFEVLDHPGTFVWPVFEAYIMNLLHLSIGKMKVAEVDGKPVGMFVWAYLPCPYTGELTSNEVIFYVDPDHRATGVGHRLLKEFVDDGMLDPEIDRLIIGRHKGTDMRVEKLYKRFGFEHDATIYRRVKKPCQE